MRETGTIAISIGEGPHGASIVLPRGHELVKHLEALIPGPMYSSKTPSPRESHMFRPPMPQPMPTSMPMYRSNDSLAALAHSLSRHAPAPTATMPSLPHYMYSDNVSSLHRPSSPYQSDSSLSSASSTHNCHVEGPAPAARRRRATAVSSHTSGKKCQIHDCEKISVSRGLCRGHGGGRRCQMAGCSKGAQSRSDFCWGHGGGQRCEVPNCMRSRKSKRFCVAHLNWEHASEGVALPTGEMTPRVLEPHKLLMPRVIAPAMPEVVHYSAAKLPSLQQALQKHQCAAPIAASHMTYSRLPLQC